MSVLVVEDEAPIRHLVRSQLEGQGVTVAEAGTVAAALEILTHTTFTVVILDLTLPDGSGLAILENLRRSRSESHVIILSGAASEADRLDALRRGADDYVVKPFFVRELTARVLAVRRRRDPGRDTRLVVGPISIDLRARVAKKDDALLELTSKEFDLLAYLAARPGHVFSRGQLLQTVWHSSSDWQQEATVTEHVRRLRGKIEDDPARPSVLVTVRGAGYRMQVGANPAAQADAKRPVTQAGTVVATDDVVVFADQTAAEMFGRKGRDDLLGASAIGLIAEQSLAAAHRRWARTAAGAPLRSESLAIRHADGSEPRVNVSSEATSWEGKPARRIDFGPVEAPSARLLHLAVGVFSELTDAVIVTDLNFHLRSWNHAAERLYGWQQHEVLGRHVLDILPWAGDEGALEKAWRTVESKGRWNGKGRHPTRDGSLVDVLVSLSVLRSDLGETIGAACVYRQIVPTPASDVVLEREVPDLADIQRGIAADEFEVHYQPLVRLEDGLILGVEALLRWNHRDLGLLAPDAFLPLAERSGLIIELGGIALERACNQAAQWVRDGFDLDVAVNLSTRQLVDPLVVQRVAAALESAGLDPDRLWLEVTETTLVEDVDKAAEVLHQLVVHGARIAIDDFGTGWASLTYLRAFPVHALKIDRSFVTGIDDSSNDAVIARSIISLADELHMSVIAEGIETAVQRDALRRLGCITGQGYLFGGPTPASDFPLERARRVQGGDDAHASLAFDPAAVAATRLRRHGSPALVRGPGAGDKAPPPRHDRVRTTNESEAIANLLRGLLHLSSERAAAALLHQTIRCLGASVVPAAEAGADALGMDVSLGQGPPLVAVAAPMSGARAHLERILPGLLEDVRHAMALSRQRERYGANSSP